MTNTRAARLQIAIHDLIDILAEDVAARAASKVLAVLPKPDERLPRPAAEPRPHTVRRLIRMKEVVHRTSLSKSTIYAKVKDGDFPAPLKLGEMSVAWLESDIELWIDQRPSDH